MKSKYIVIGIIVVVIIVGVIFITGYTEQIEETPETVEEEAFVSFNFVEGDNESWHVQSSEMGKYVLSPSWFRFDYESREGKEPALMCRQFKSLEDARNKINQLSEVKKEPIEKAPGRYSLILSEKEMKETLVNINIAISNFPPKSYVIYKYESGEEPLAEEKGEQKEEDKKELKEPPKETKQEETLTQEEKEIIEFLEAEDEQFDSPAVNKIRAAFRVNYFYEHPENNFINQEATGWKHWDADFWNLKDDSGEPVVGLGATFTTDLVASNWKKENAIKIGPPIYVFSFDDVPQQEEDEPIFRPSPIMEFPNQAVIYTPGFDASRSADKTVFSGPGIQTLTLTIIPRDENIEKISDGIFMCIYTVEPGAENLVDAFFISSTHEEYIEISEDKRSLRVYEVPAKTDVLWSIDITIEVTPKPGVAKVEFLPFTSFLWNCGLTEEPYGRGTTTGSSVSCAADSVGTWKWKAKGNYIWEWENGLCACSVAFPHLQGRVENE